MQIVPDSIEDFPRPSMLLVPMLKHDGSAARIAVEVGQKVRPGELIGRADGPEGLDVHAPLAGKVTAIGQVDTARALGIPAVHIRTTDAKAPQAQSIEFPNESGRLTIKKLADSTDKAGLTDFAPAAIGLGNKLRKAAEKGVSQIIINAIAPE